MKDLLDLRGSNTIKTPDWRPMPQYVIKLVNPAGVWLGPHQHYVTDKDQALTFEFRTLALHHAIDAGYALDAFTVEAR